MWQLITAAYMLPESERNTCVCTPFFSAGRAACGDIRLNIWSTSQAHITGFTCWIALLMWPYTAVAGKGVESIAKLSWHCIYVSVSDQLIWQTCLLVIINKAAILIYWPPHGLEWRIYLFVTVQPLYRPFYVSWTQPRGCDVSVHGQFLRPAPCGTDCINITYLNVSKIVHMNAVQCDEVCSEVCTKGVESCWQTQWTYDILVAIRFDISACSRCSSW